MSLYIQVYSQCMAAIFIVSRSTCKWQSRWARATARRVACPEHTLRLLLPHIKLVCRSLWRAGRQAFSQQLLIATLARSNAICGKFGWLQSSQKCKPFSQIEPIYLPFSRSGRSSIYLHFVWTAKLDSCLSAAADVAAPQQPPPNCNCNSDLTPLTKLRAESSLAKVTNAAWQEAAAAALPTIKSYFLLLRLLFRLLLLLSSYVDPVCWLWLLCRPHLSFILMRT